MLGLVGIAIKAGEEMEAAAARQYREKSIWWISNNRGSIDQLINELTYVTAVVNRQEIPDWNTRIKFIPETFTMKKTYQCWYREIRNDSVLMVSECHMLIPDAFNTSTRTKIFSYIFYAALNKQTGN